MGAGASTDEVTNGAAVPYSMHFSSIPSDSRRTALLRSTTVRYTFSHARDNTSGAIDTSRKAPNDLDPLLTALALLSIAGLAAPRIGQAQSFKVEKFDIKGEGGTDYLTVETSTGRVFVSRADHVMVVEGATGKVLGDIPNTPRVHGVGIAPKAGHGFTTNGGNETVTMFDLQTLAVLRQIKVGPGLDGIMYDAPDDKIILTNHSRPIGTLTALNPQTGDIVATVELEDTSPEGAATDGKGPYLRQQRGQVHDTGHRRATWKVTASWPLAPCDGPTGIAYDAVSNRLFSGCSKTSVVVDAETARWSRPSRTAHAWMPWAGIRRRS
jgi:DNA-binding beta-propeller fold protein YncE